MNEGYKETVEQESNNNPYNPALSPQHEGWSRVHNHLSLSTVLCLFVLLSYELMQVDILEEERVSKKWNNNNKKLHAHFHPSRYNMFIYFLFFFKFYVLLLDVAVALSCELSSRTLANSGSLQQPLGKPDCYWKARLCVKTVSCTALLECPVGKARLWKATNDLHIRNRGHPQSKEDLWTQAVSSANHGIGTQGWTG